jgi:DNA-binding GntR family transcriptional regulator
MLLMTMADEVVAEVRAGIRERRYVPGTIYSVYQLSDLLGVSRSPVREAMLRLAEAGLVEIVRNRGFRVLLPAARDLAEIFAVRLALEVPAAGRVSSASLPALRATVAAMASAASPAEFWAADRLLHHTILVDAGNARAARIVAGLRDTTALLGDPTGRTPEAICAEHAAVVDAVADGSPGAAEAAMRSHLTSTGLLLMARAASLPVDDASVLALWEEVVGVR